MKAGTILKKGRIRLHLGIASIFVIIVAALTTVIVWNNYLQASSAALQTADQLFAEITTKVDERINGMLGGVKATVDASSAMPGLSGRPHFDGLSYPALEPMIRMIEAQPHVYSVFSGFSSGDWIQVAATRGDPDVVAAFQIPDGADFTIRTISTDRAGKRRQYWRYLDRDRRIVGARTEADPSYDPRLRGWYTGALAARRALFSEPFVFAALKKPGITASRRLIGGSGVFGVAVTLANLSQFLSQQLASENSVVFIFNSNGEILGHQDPLLATPHVGEEGAKLPKAAEVGNPIVDLVVGLGLSSGPVAAATRKLDVEGQPWLVRVAPAGSRLGLDQYIAIAAPLSDFTGHIERMQQRSIVASLIAIAIALPLIYLIARRIAAKLTALAVEADKIRGFELDSPVSVESRFVEVQNLSLAFGAMKQAVRVFGSYVPKALVREIVQSGTQPELGGSRREITVLFTDVADYTRIAESTAPEDLMLRTSEYFEALGTVLSQHHGVVDKYIGDAIMALWNAPTSDDEHVVHACAAVLACRDRSRALAESWARRDIEIFGTRFGLHCGEAVVGNVGGADRMNFTAVGATINLASRLEALNKRYGTEILVSQQVAARAGSRFLTRLIDRVQPVGTNTPVDIYELMAARADRTGLPESLVASAGQLELCVLWGRAQAVYAERDWPRALKLFEAVVKDYPNDRPSRIYADRCRGFAGAPPAPDWDGVTVLDSK